MLPQLMAGFKVKVPEGVNGQCYLVLTGCRDAVSDDTVAAGLTTVEVTNPYNQGINDLIEQEIDESGDGNAGGRKLRSMDD